MGGKGKGRGDGKGRVGEAGEYFASTRDAPDKTLGLS